MTRTIVVKGVGKAALPADTIQINIDLINLDLDYEKAMEKAGKSLNMLRDSLKSEAFEKEDIKTRSFNVDAKYESRQDSQGNYKRFFVGYEVINSMTIEFPEDSKKLGRVLYLLTTSSTKPEIRIIYKLKDDREIKKLLLEDAVADAKIKAETLASAAGLNLGEILNIQYDWSELEIGFLNYDLAPRDAMMATSESTIDLQADDIAADDSVRVTWLIKD